MKSIKHSKFRNTGFIFELLVRQVTSDILNGRPKSIAENLLKKYFNSKTELHSELKLYQFLVNEKYNAENRAEKFISAILETRSKLNEKKILREKYELIKEIKENYNLDSFLNTQIPNYKVLASIYKIFEYSSTKDSSAIYDPKDVLNTKLTIVEHIISKPAGKGNSEEKIYESFKKEDKDIRDLSYKILVDSFNKKYKTLDESQKSLLKTYINSYTNEDSLSENIKKKVTELKNEFIAISKNINDKVTKIKLAETVNQLKKIGETKKIKDSHISAIMISYELKKELLNAIGK
jgi:hypothetical protein